LHWLADSGRRPCPCMHHHRRIKRKSWRGMGWPLQPRREVDERACSARGGSRRSVSERTKAEPFLKKLAPARQRRRGKTRSGRARGRNYSSHRIAFIRMRCRCGKGRCRSTAGHPESSRDRERSLVGLMMNGIGIRVCPCLCSCSCSYASPSSPIHRAHARALCPRRGLRSGTTTTHVNLTHA